MISRVRGVLLPREAGAEVEAGGAVVEVATPGGVVYEVQVPRTVFERLPAPGSEVELRIHHQVKADGQLLYGFLDPVERLLFRVLLGAPNVGGRTALALLSTMPASRLARALESRDLAALAQAPGVGKRTAENIAVAVSEKVKALGITQALPGSGEGAVASPSMAAVRALVALGMSGDEAEKAVVRVLEADSEADTDTLIRRSLASR